MTSARIQVAPESFLLSEKCRYYIGLSKLKTHRNLKMKKNQKLIFDVGMHKGEDSKYYLSKGFNVIAFEANPDLIKQCQTEFEKEIREGQLTIVEGAIVGEEQMKDPTVKFFQNTNVSIWGTVVSEWAERNKNFGASSEIIEVPAINFRQCLEEFGIPYYLKIDIEGMDLICLEALKHFEIKPDYISIESEKASFQKLKKEFEILESLGYNSYQLINQGEVTEMKEPQNSTEGRFANYRFEYGSSGLFGTDLPFKWISKSAALSRYRWIFFGYKIWGDRSRIKYWYVLRLLRNLLIKFTGTNIPGWYDTHAKHSSVGNRN